jgi:hypothetical protein
MLKVLLAALVLSTSVFAADEVKKPDPVFQEAGYNFVGVSLGVAKPAGSNIQSMPARFNFGAEYSHALSKEFAVGAFIDRNNAEAAENSDVDFGITRLGVQAAYNTTYDSMFTLRAGLGFLSYSTTIAGGGVTVTPDSEPFFVAPGFGIIFPIMDRMQLIPNIGYTFFFENSDVESFQVFDAAMTLRYNF